MEILNALRAIELRNMELDAEKAELEQRRRALLGLDAGARKPARKTLSHAQGKTAFAALKKGREHERSATG